MFGKLLKYNMKESGRFNLMATVIALGLVVINLGLYWFLLYTEQNPGKFPFIDSLGLTDSTFLITLCIYMIAMILPILICLCSLIDFYKTSYGQAGYLTRLIPTKQSTIFRSKFLTVYLWTLFALLISFAAIFGWVFVTQLIEGNEFDMLLGFFGLDISEMLETLPLVTRLIIYIGAIPVFLLLLFIVIVVFIYIFALAQKRPFRRMGFGGVMIWVGIFYFIFQAFIWLCLLFPWQLALDSNGYFTIITSELWAGYTEGIGEPDYGVSLLGIALPPIFAIIAFFYSKKQYSSNINMR